MSISGKTKQLLLSIFVSTILAALSVFSNIFGIFGKKLHSYIFSGFILFLIIILLVFYMCKKDKLFRFTLIVSGYVIFFGGIYIALKGTGVIDKISDIQGMRQLITLSGSSGILVFLAITLLQVLFIPIPAIITIVAGSMLFGPITAFLICTTGIVLGSLIAFWIGRIFGKRALHWIDQDDKSKKYLNILHKNHGLVLFFMFLLPLFPDDLLCVLAGISTMSARQFALIVIIARTLGVATIAFFGSGKIIPFSGWGVIVWISLALLAVLIYITISKVKKKIER